MLLRRLKHRDWGFHASLASETISLDGWMNEGWVDGWMNKWEREELLWKLSRGDGVGPHVLLLYPAQR